MTQQDLKQAYNRQNWQTWLQDIFGSQVQFEIQAESVEVDRENIKSIQRFGVIKLADEKNLAVLDIETREGVQIARNRVGLRELVMKFIDHARYHGILAFYHGNTPEYRMSFICSEPTIDDEGNFSIQSTAPKRFTYVLGENEKTKTPADRLKIIAGKRGSVMLEDIKSAFSVETLTKEFYAELSNWYFWALQNVDFPNDLYQDKEVNNATSVIRLITRLMFVWFLKQKKLIKEELFDPQELDKILNYKDKNGSTFYKAILQNLFFATLNNEMGEKRTFINRQYGVQNYYRYERFFKNKERFLELTKNTPFLNGGLFENLDKNVGEDNEKRVDCFSNRIDKELLLKVPDFLFFDDEQTVDLNKIYDTKGKIYKVRGVLNILKTYNFTIEENTSTDIEIALDPELLGKVFENLLASFNPETQTTARKQTGSFYTPREIVDYMVQESLTAYLQQITNRELQITNEGNIEITDGTTINDEIKSQIINALNIAKILDPACGSGAFPMGILQKMVQILQNLDPDNKQWREVQKQKAIKETEEAYNIGDKEERQKRLLDIDEAFDNNSSDYGRKLYLIENSIFGVDIQPIAVQISKLRFFISLICEQEPNSEKPNLGIRPLPNLETKFVAANTLIGLDKPEQTNLFRTPEIIAKENELKEVRHKHFSARTPETKAKYRDKDEEVRYEIADILTTLGYAEETAQKLALWNPYDQSSFSQFFDMEWMFGITDGFDVVIGNPPYVKEGRISKELFEQYKNSPYYQGKMDLWYMFACYGIDFLKNDGQLCFIATNNWVTSSGASKLRNKIISDAQIKQLVDFGNFMIFESASIQTMVMLFSKNSTADNYYFDYRKLEGETEIEDVLDLLKEKQNVKATYFSPLLVRNDMIDKFLIFSSNETILDKIAGKRTYLTEKEVANGIHPHYDFVNNKLASIHNLVVGEGIFGLSENEKNNLQLSENELNLIKPYYTTEQIHRYYSNSDNKLWLIYTDSSFKNPSSMDNYPNLKRHLDRFANVITSDNKPYGLHRTREERFFRGEKIIVQRKCVGQPSFSYSDFDCYVSATFYVIKTNRFNLKYLVGLLNSKLIAFWLRNKGKMQGNNYQLDKEPLLQIPIINATIEQQLPLIALVNQILAAKKVNPAADTSELEREIDVLVYELYGLTEEEIAVIEGKN